jgi:hypothetical protein
MATNAQIDEIIKVNEGIAHSTPSWEKGEGENYDIEINNPNELRHAKEKHITYAVTPTSGVVNPGTPTVQLVATAVNGKGDTYTSDVTPEAFLWRSNTPNVTVDANGLATYVSGDGVALVGALCMVLNPHQIFQSDAIMADITYSSTMTVTNDAPEEGEPETETPKKKRGRKKSDK